MHFLSALMAKLPLLLLLLSAPALSAELTGTVTLSLDSQPVPYAQVRYVAQATGTVYATQTDTDGAYRLSFPEPVTAVEEGSSLPAHTALRWAYPNPFNPSVTLPFDLAEAGPVRLLLFDALGRPVRRLLDQELPAGRHQPVWDGCDDQGRPAGAGVYLYHLETGEYQATRKLTLTDGLPSRALKSAVESRGCGEYTVQVQGPAIRSLTLPGVDPCSPGFDPHFQVEPDQMLLALSGDQTSLLLGVPGGWFTMGSPLYQDENPEHRVFLDPYYVEAQEVTVARYRACVETGACLEPAQGQTCNWGVKERDDHPVNCLSWYEAQRYCQWAGLRLPTEAEWEKAARGSAGRIYPWGDEPPGGAGNCDRAVMMRAGLGLGCGYDGTGPVATRQADTSVYGARDLAGNVWEWVDDWYQPDYYARSPQHNPRNQASATHKGLRGNSWHYVDPDLDLRAANRYRFRPLRWYPYIGLRCVRSADPQSPAPPVLAPPAGEAALLGVSDWLVRNRMARAAEGDTLPTAPASTDEMVLIPAGEFLMGFDRGQGDERPRHPVYLSAYYLDKYEVSVAQYRACVEAGQCTRPYSGEAAYRLPFEGGYTNWDKPDRDHHPVNAVNWDQADQYCRWAGKRLPTEAEWEKAGGGNGRVYPWGDEQPSCERAVIDDGGDGCGQDSTWPVGTKPAGASPYGVMDLAGNVWEWVDDWYERDYYQRAPPLDPRNTDPGVEGLKVLRGGSLADQNTHIYALSNRLAYDPWQGFDYTIGFRCARPAPGH